MYFRISMTMRNQTHTPILHLHPLVLKHAQIQPQSHLNWTPCVAHGLLETQGLQYGEACRRFLHQNHCQPENIVNTCNLQKYIRQPSFRGPTQALLRQQGTAATLCACPTGSSVQCRIATTTGRPDRAASACRAALQSDCRRRGGRWAPPVAR